MNSHSDRLAGKVAVVTGAAQGIGRSYAIALAQAGARLCVSDIVYPEETMAELTAVTGNGRAIAIQADVTDQSSLDAMVAYAVSNFGRLDILVNNAALFSALRMKRFDEIAPDEWDRVMVVNVRGTWQATVAAVPAMRASGGGKIVNVASATALKGTPLLLHYVTSKGAIIALTRSLARELAQDSICVNAIAPGLVMSPNVQAHPDWQDMADQVVATRAIKRDSTPQDLIGPLLFLVSDDSDFMTGQALIVDGGTVMH